jgi:hypothetical protein
MDRGKLPLAQAILRSKCQCYGFKMIDRTLTDAVHRNLSRHRLRGGRANVNSWRSFDGYVEQNQLRESREAFAVPPNAFRRAANAPESCCCVTDSGKGMDRTGRFVRASRVNSSANG